MLITSNSDAPVWPQRNPAPVSNTDQDATTSNSNAAAAATIAGKGGPWNTSTVGHTPIAGSSESAKSAPTNPDPSAGGSGTSATSVAGNQHDRAPNPGRAERGTAEPHETPVRREQESSEKSAEQAQSRMAVDLQIKSLATQTSQTGPKAIADHTIINQAVSAYMEFGPDRQQAKTNKAA